MATSATGARPSPRRRASPEQAEGPGPQRRESPHWRQGPGLRRGDEHEANGFTLVELMIVLAIIGLMTGVVALTIPDPRGRLTDSAETFAARVLAARDAAVIDGREVALSIDPLGYRFEERRRGRWQPVAQSALRDARWGEGVGVAIGRESRNRIIIDTTGQVSEPVTVTLRRDGAQVAIAVGQDGVVRVGG